MEPPVWTRKKFITFHDLTCPWTRTSNARTVTSDLNTKEVWLRTLNSSMRKEKTTNVLFVILLLWRDKIWIHMLRRFIWSSETKSAGNVITRLVTLVTCASMWDGFIRKSRITSAQFAATSLPQTLSWFATSRFMKSWKKCQKIPETKREPRNMIAHVVTKSSVPWKAWSNTGFIAQVTLSEKSLSAWNVALHPQKCQSGHATLSHPVVKTVMILFVIDEVIKVYCHHHACWLELPLCILWLQV